MPTGMTNFAGLGLTPKITWAKTLWKAAREGMFMNRFVGTDEGSMIQRVTELTKTSQGDKCIMNLVADLVEDGVTGDNQREGREEAMQAFEEEIIIDLLTHSVKNKGKMAEQKSVIKFRETGRDRLAYWLSNRLDQLGMLTLSGIDYSYNCDGSLRPSNVFTELAFASHVSAPTNRRHLNWTGTEMEDGDTTRITSAYLPKYAMIVDGLVYAKDHYLTPLRKDGKEYYIVLVKPGTLGLFKKDPDYLRAVVAVAGKSGLDSPFFTGATVTVDGAVLHESRLVYSTIKAASGSKWGATGTVNGTRSLVCGAQALGFADLGAPDWVEKLFDFDSRAAINVDKIVGLVKPKFHSAYDDSVQDFGVIAIDHYLPGNN